MNENTIPVPPPLPGMREPNPPLPAKKNRVRTLYDTWNQRYPWLFGALFFVGGVSFDMATVGRIDELYTIAQLGTYLFLLSLLISLDFAMEFRVAPLPKFAAKIWHYHEEGIHFLFGTLLSVFNLFYFKSASFTTSFLFLFLIWFLLLANEFPQFRRFGVPMRFALYGICLASYFGIVVPVLWGRIGPLPFFVSVMAAICVLFVLGAILWKTLGHTYELVRRAIAPALAVLAIYSLFYFFSWIPPVPLSIHYMGIYHAVERDHGSYRLSHQRPWWKFWKVGDQEYFYRPGDKLVAFVRIFSPGKFAGKIFIRWAHWENNSWHVWDAIPIHIVGGREEGFRGVAIKENFTLGDWRVQYETEDQREIGRMHFNVKPDPVQGERVFSQDVQ